MTDAEQIQYNRFLAAGYDPDLVAALIKRGAWLGIRDPLADDIDEINRYRADVSRREKRDADVGAVSAGADPPSG